MRIRAPGLAAVARISACLMLWGIGTGAGASQVVIGVLAHRGEDAAQAAWDPTAAYLTDRIPGTTFVVRGFNNPGLERAVASAQVDFVLTNPGSYVSLEARHGISRMLTLRNLREGKPYTNFGAVIFTRADRADIRTLTDLRDRRFMAVRPQAFGGFQLAWRELAAAGVDPFHDLAELKFSGLPQDTIVYAVRDGLVDAGTVRTDTLERMAREGQIKLDDIFVINQQHVAEFPFLLSTRLYPEWAFARLRHVSDEVARRVAVALMLMPADSAPARASLSAGWTVPLDYRPVHELFRELRIGPYEYLRPASLGDYLREHRDKFLIAVSLLLAVVLASTLYVLRLNRRLHQSRERLQQLTGELANSNIELKYLSLHDDLTGLANQKWFHETLAAEWHRARRGHAFLSLLMIDIDEFKAHNDHLGHRAGDETLKAVAAALRHGARRSMDFVARYGGEEFAVILPGLDATAAAAVAEGMRASVEALRIANPGGVHHNLIAVSIGVAVARPDTKLAIETLVEAADAALYEAKAAGRNTVRLSPELG